VSPDVASERPLRGSERVTIALLGLPTFALALVTTVVTTYLPVVLQGFVGSTVVVGVIVGIEGLVALWLPLVVGSWSDRLRTPLGGRVPFLLAATPLVVVGLVAMSLISSVVAIGGAALVFFLGYFVAYEPYRALYPDTVDEEVRGRAQASQAVWRGLGTGVALVSGGLLLGIGRGAPFLAGAALYVACILAFSIALARRGVPEQEDPGERTLRQSVEDVWRLVMDHAELRSFLVANALWELSLAALKTFVVLYVTTGMGYSRSQGSLIIGGVAVLVLLAALASGRLADRYGHLRVLRTALPIYGIGFLVPFVTTSPLLIIVALPFIAAGGGVIMALPYAVLMPLMPEDRHGALTGYYSFSRGLGTWLGPMLGGVAIIATTGLFSDTKGYQAVWGVCSLAVLLSLWPLRRLRDETDS
jgi:MFS family permease